MIEIADGSIGAGKTMFMTWKVLCKYLEGYTIVANYHLKNIPYTRIDSIKSLLAVKGDRIFFAGDEFWQDLDARSGYTDAKKKENLLKEMMQTRKKKIDAFFTCQVYDSMMDRRLRGITARIYKPYVMVRDKNDIAIDPEGKPLILGVDFYDKKAPNTRRHMVIPVVIPGVYDIPNSYDSWEIVDELEGTEKDDLNALIKKYTNESAKNQSQLASVIKYKEMLAGNPLTDKYCSYLSKLIYYLRDSSNE